MGEGVGLIASRSVFRPTNPRIVPALVVAIVSLGAPSAASADGSPVLTALDAERCPAAQRYFNHEPAYGLIRLEEARAGRFKVFQRLGPDRLIPPIDWVADPYGNEDWRSSLHSLEWLDPLFHLDANPGLRLDPIARDLARDEGSRVDLARARDIVLDWIAANPPGGEGVDERAWGNKIAAERAGYIAYALRAGRCADLVDDRSAERMISSLALHARFLAAQRIPGNHGLFVDYGLALIAREVPFIEGAADFERLARARFEQQLDERLDSGDALWREHSPTYQFLVLRLVGKMAVLTRDRGLGRTAQAMERSAPWLLNPAGRLLQFGDSYASRVAPRIRARAARLDGTRAFFDSGYAAIREPREGNLLALAAGYFNRWHKHGDDLSYDLFDRGTHVVADSGRFGKSASKDFARSAPAHSTLTVDGVDFADRLRPFYGSGLDATGKGDGWHALLAHNPRLLEQDVRHARLLLYRPGTALIVIDELDADAPHLYRRFVQLGPEISIDAREDGLRLFSPGGFEGLLNDAPVGEAVDLTTARGDRETPSGLIFPSFRRALPRWTVGLRSRAEDAVYALTIGLDGPGATKARLAKPDRADQLLIDRPGQRTERLSVEREGKRLRVRVRDQSLVKGFFR